MKSLAETDKGQVSLLLYELFDNSELFSLHTIALHTITITGASGEKKR